MKIYSIHTTLTKDVVDVLLKNLVTEHGYWGKVTSDEFELARFSLFYRTGDFLYPYLKGKVTATDTGSVITFRAVPTKRSVVIPSVFFVLLLLFFIGMSIFLKWDGLSFIGIALIFGVAAAFRYLYFLRATAISIAILKKYLRENEAKP